MEIRLEAVSHLFESTDLMLKEVLPALEADDWHHQVEDGNHALWILGHITVLRHRLANVLNGKDTPIPFEEVFGTSPDYTTDYPEPASVVVAFHRTQDLLRDAFESTTADQLNGPGRGHGEFLTSDKTLLGTITFLGYHEAYHVGQLVYLANLLNRLPEAGIYG